MLRFLVRLLLLRFVPADAQITEAVSGGGTTSGAADTVAGAAEPVEAPSGMPCEDDPGQAKCCMMSFAYGTTAAQQDGSSKQCLLADMVGNPGEFCSEACEKRYKSLGYDCWKAFNVGLEWYFMQKLCDSQNSYYKNGYFNPPPDHPDYLLSGIYIPGGGEFQGKKGTASFGRQTAPGGGLLLLPLLLWGGVWRAAGFGGPPLANH